MKDFKLTQAISTAEKIVQDENLVLPVDVFSIAEQENIHIEPKPDSVAGVSGMLLRYREQFTIIYATHIKNEGFQRFSIAHELSHYFLPSHPENIFRDGKNIHESHAGFTSSNQIEKETDHFAAGLLMPKKLIIKEAGKCKDGLSSIEHLSKICKTSLTSSAIRYTEITDAAVAVIVSSDNVVEYCFCSSAINLKAFRT
ncbi:ImmA/IrrE family metallo-endopeptidase [Legionella israelensis]|uniref:IrrE N-terminal-like domain-containing protein n=1 Tax=Legionella israelensis TaxID=454 RepID=A0A0W0WIG7_9GAMM|nr:ImmA/IrrE family metallo-endopeptidase [Legionella israelensis]KTD31830.1 hypothetical protein Lisr_0583 [Legionella israelensis]QBS10697.1 ImmA/IrrE family metallo-endopeptidase [Legionella israelensis]SCY45891.1 protein of unknown function [Legionella israelensis DSM 19235]STX57658.1 Domain of uncharacterised function (DUF955) [Legionella israelensis]